MQKFNFERLEVWQEAAKLTVLVYKLSDKLPADERFGMKSQVRRSVHSVPSNIAEGSGRATGKDQAYFTTVAYGSLVETLNHLLIAVLHGYLEEANVAPLRERFVRIAKQLSTLRRKQRQSKGLDNNLAQEPPPGYGEDYTLPPLD